MSTDLFDLTDVTAQAVSDGDNLSIGIAKHAAEMESFRATLTEQRLEGVSDPDVLRRKEREIEDLCYKESVRLLNQKLPGLDDRLRLASERAAAAEKILEVAPNARAMVECLASREPEFREYLNELRGAGTATLTSRLRMVMALPPTTRTRAEAGAILRLIDALPKAERPVDSGEIATRILGPYHAAMQENVGVVKFHAERLQVQSQGYPPTPAQRVRLGMLAKELGLEKAAIPDFTTSATPKGDALTKIQAGLAKRAQS